MAEETEPTAAEQAANAIPEVTIIQDGKIVMHYSLDEQAAEDEQGAEASRG